MTQRTYYKEIPANFYKGMIKASIYEACPRLSPTKPRHINYEMEQELVKF